MLMVQLDCHNAKEVLDSKFNKLNIPVGSEGIIVMRDRGATSKEVALYIDNSKNWLRVTIKETNQNNSSWCAMQVNASIYNRLITQFVTESYQSLGVVFDDETLAGEYYAVKYVAINHEKKVYLGNPRACGHPEAIDFAETIDRVMRELGI